jgi:hypothetical protein
MATGEALTSVGWMLTKLGLAVCASALVLFFAYLLVQSMWKSLRKKR